jgi:hypothetical protein
MHRPQVRAVFVQVNPLISHRQDVFLSTGKRYQRLSDPGILFIGIIYGYYKLVYVKYLYKIKHIALHLVT